MRPRRLMCPCSSACQALSSTCPAAGSTVRREMKTGRPGLFRRHGEQGRGARSGVGVDMSRQLGERLDLKLGALFAPARDEPGNP